MLYKVTRKDFDIALSKGYSKIINTMQYNAVYQKREKWYVGWIENFPGVHTQGKTLAEVKANLKEALTLVLEVRKSMLKKEQLQGRVVREKITM